MKFSQGYLHREIPKGTQAARAPNERGVRKISNIRRRISEMLQDRTKVIMTD